MARFEREDDELRRALEAEFVQEMVRLAKGARDNPVTEAVMRIRALGEIAEALSTEDLVTLAGAVSGGLASPLWPHARCGQNLPAQPRSWRRN